MKEVNIYICTSIRGPQRRDGAGMYILSYTAANGKTADKGNMVFCQDTTENQLAVLALAEALACLKTSCRIKLYLDCCYAAAALKGRWYEKWRYAGWMNARSQPVSDAETWQMIESRLAVHDLEVLLGQEHPYRRWMLRELCAHKAAS